MVDVIHYFFEQDNTYVSREEAMSTSEVRKSLYENLYEKEYKYYIDPSVFDPENKNRGGRQYVADSNFVDEPFDPLRKSERKPFVPATELKDEQPLPFGAVLDAPLG